MSILIVILTLRGKRNLDLAIQELILTGEGKQDAQQHVVFGAIGAHGQLALEVIINLVTELALALP